MNKINALINIYNEKINGWSNHLGNLEHLNIPLYKIQISNLKDDSYFILPICCGGLNSYLDIKDDGLSSLEYKIVNKEEFLDKHEFISVT